MTSFMTHFPILAIMALFFGAFLVALVGRKSEILRNGIAFLVTGGAMVLMLALIKPVMIDGEIITYWLGNRHRHRSRCAEPVLRPGDYRGRVCLLHLCFLLHEGR